MSDILLYLLIARLIIQNQQQVAVRQLAYAIRRIYAGHKLSINEPFYTVYEAYGLDLK